MKARGHNGTVEFDGRTITIRREGMLARLVFGDDVKTIPLRAITGVQWKKPGHILNGHIGFTLPGATEAEGGITPNVGDRNAVVFTRKQREAFEEMRTAIERALAVTR